MNNLLLQALECKPLPRPPIWLMRQAGRYLESYRNLRKKHSFHTLISTPELAYEITMMPIEMFHLDAAILFSDILFLTEIFGFKISFQENKGMQLIPPTSEQDMKDQHVFSTVSKTISLLKKNLTVPLIGFCGGPYTVGKYMNCLTAEWLDKITNLTIEYLKMQIVSGVDVIQIFDSWAGYLSVEEFNNLAFPYLKRILIALEPLGIPVILFCRGSCRFVSQLSSLLPRAISFDWERPLLELRQEVPSTIAVQGNLDPLILSGPLEVLQVHVEELLTSMKDQKGFIFNLGHGVLPHTPVENVQWLVHRVKALNSLSRQ